MIYYILISLCLIILVAYIFEVTGKYTKIPGVILLMVLGLSLRYFTSYKEFNIPDLSILLPLMGTLGLILIVLEGSLDLKISREKKGLIIKSFSSALFLFISFSLIFSTVLYHFYQVEFTTALINSIPIGIISSAVAISLLL